MKQNNVQLLISILLIFFTIFSCKQIMPIRTIDNDQIVFLSDRDQSGRRFDIFLFNTNSHQLTNLTKTIDTLDINSNSSPVLNRTRQSVLFLAFNPRKLVELDVNNNNVRAIAPFDYEAMDYVLAPDGQSVIYTEKVDNRIQIFKLDIESGRKINLSYNSYNNYEPRFSSDGKTIVYVCDQDGSRSIATMSSDGRTQKLLTNAFGDDRYPHISPDKKQIVFCSSRGGLNDYDYDLYLVDIDGSNLRLLHDSNAYDTNPIFSPDYKYVCFISNQRGRLCSNIYLKNLHTGSLQMITKPLEHFNQNHHFSADNKYVIFENMGPVDSEILRYEIREKEIQSIASHKGRDLSPAL